MSGPSLKLVVAWSDSRNLCALGDDASVVHAPETASAIRDRLRERLSAGDHVFVAEFETWSGHGPAMDSGWLLARGH